MKRIFPFLTIFLALLIVFTANAQETLDLNAMSVEIWPEYDQPAVLVITHLSLDPNTILPATLVLHVPAQAEIYAVAVDDPAMGLLNAPYDRTVQGSWAELSITANLPNVQMEYYIPLIKNGTTRHVVYEWLGDYAIDSYQIAVQQPIGTTDFISDPILPITSVGQDGFTYMQTATQALAAGETFILTVDYQKSGDTLSTTGLPVVPEQPISTNTPGRVTSHDLLLMLAGIGGLLVLVGAAGGLYVWKNSTKRPSIPEKRSATHRTKKTNPVYCPKCGKRAQNGDAFCRTCGTRLPK